MDELPGFAGGGDEVEPAPGDVEAFTEAEDAVGERVAVVVVVEEPAVQFLFAPRKALDLKPVDDLPPARERNDLLRRSSQDAAECLLSVDRSHPRRWCFHSTSAWLATAKMSRGEI